MFKELTAEEVQQVTAGADDGDPIGAPHGRW